MQKKVKFYMFETLHPNFQNGQLYDVLFKFDQRSNSNSNQNTKNEKNALLQRQKSLQNTNGHFQDVFYKNLSSNQKQNSNDFHFYKSV